MTPEEPGLNVTGSDTSAPPGTSSVSGTVNGASTDTAIVFATRARFTTTSGFTLEKLRAVGPNSIVWGMASSAEPAETTAGPVHPTITNASAPSLMKAPSGNLRARAGCVVTTPSWTS